MQNFLTQYGLIAIFLCAIIENDIIFILTGVVINFNTEQPVPAFIACLCGALVHDTIWFAVGHKRSAAVRNSRIYRKVGPLVERLANALGPWELFFCRFIYGTRNPSLVFWGVHKLSLPRFYMIEVLALTMWGGGLTLLGYFLSDRASAVIGSVKRIEHYLLAALILGVVCFVAARFFTRHEIKKHLPPAP